MNKTENVNVDIFKWAHEHRTELAWMSQNTNHLSPTKVINEAVRDAIDKKLYEWYPYSKGLFGLSDLILKDLEMENQEIILTSGGTEALYILTRSLLSLGDEVIASDPSYFIIHKFIKLSGGKVLELPIYKDPWKLSVDQINESINSKTKMILLIDPLNPTGSGYSKDEVRAISEIAKDNKLLIINDITYRDFSDAHYPSALFYPEGSITIFSVSKNCGLAGMRVGALISSHELMEKMSPYNTNDLSINIIGQVAAYNAIKTKNEWFPEVKKTARNNQKLIKEMADRIEGIFLPVYPSQANMFLVDISHTGIKPEDVQTKLLFEHKVFVRAGNYVSAKYGENFIRVSFTVPTEHALRFVKAFPTVIQELKRR